jgi:hypothetical protein
MYRALFNFAELEDAEGFMNWLGKMYADADF